MKLINLILSLSLIASLISCNGENSSSKENSEPQTSINAIENTKWIITKLEGQEIEVQKNESIYFMLNANEKSISGFAGCNTFNGSYKLEDGNRIKFDKVAVTLMSCPDLTINETELLEVFNLADNFTISNNVLSLNVGKRAPLAEFKSAK